MDPEVLVTADAVDGHTARRDYAKGELLEGNVSTDPFAQFALWLDEARSNDNIDEAQAMTVATIDSRQRPTARIVLLRGVDDASVGRRGFVFYTNYDSAKGHAIAHNNAVALVFYWGPLERSVRIEGHAEKVDTAESDAYFASRPHKSKLGAIVSSQSSMIDSRQVLEEEMSVLDDRYAEGADVPRPTHWGGYRVVPDSVEFWQGRRSRLHDRLVYTLIDDAWTLTRLAP